MRFALLGDHPDGLDLARALAASGRHEVASYHGPAIGAEALRRAGVVPQVFADLEELLSDPALDAIIVASRPDDRPAHLRRALQSEHHVLCVHPADQTPDAAYEAAMIGQDTRKLLLPVLPAVLHPAVVRLGRLVRDADPFRLLDVELSAAEPLVLDGGPPGRKPSFPGWDVLRAVGGEVAEVGGFAEKEEVLADEPVLLFGRFERPLLFRIALLPGAADARWRLQLVGRHENAELVFPNGWPGPCRLSWSDATGAAHDELWDAWDPWPPLVEEFERQLARGTPVIEPTRTTADALSWQAEMRALELDDAARRAVVRRRANLLEYPEASEEVGFKGTMTLLGCSLLWGALFLLILSRWLPWLGWLIVPALVVFLGLQALRWLVFKQPRPANAETRADGRP